MSIKISSSGVISTPLQVYRGQARNLIADGALQNSGFGGYYGQSGYSPWSVSYLSGGGWTRNSDGDQTWTYRSLFGFNMCGGSASGVSMMSQSMPTPTANHKYYGAIWYKSTGTAVDNRFEWYLNDTTKCTSESTTTQTSVTDIVFHAKGNTNGVWTCGSGVRQASSYTSGSWQIRNFVVNPTGSFLIARMMIFDINEMFGDSVANDHTNSWWKTWCDKYVREHWSFCGFCTSAPITSGSCTPSGWSTSPTFRDWGNQNANTMPRDRMYYGGTSGSGSECFLYVYTAPAYVKNHRYYCRFWESTGYLSGCSKTTDVYFPEAEPRIIPGISNYPRSKLAYSLGRSYQWKEQSGLFTQSTSSGVGAIYFRIDYNNSGSSESGKGYCDMAMYDLSAWNPLTAHINLVADSYYHSIYPMPTEIPRVSSTGLTSSWTRSQLDWVLDGYSQPFIHCPQPTSNIQMQYNKTGAYSTYSNLQPRSYTGDIIVCGDVIPTYGGQFKMGKDYLLYCNDFDGYFYSNS